MYRHGFFVEENENEIVLNFWGGIQTYNKKTKTYRMDRSSGIFSNLTVSIYGIFVLTINGYEVENVELIMKDYFLHLDTYPLVFVKNDKKLDFSDLEKREIEFFLNHSHPTNLGLHFKNGSTKETFNFKITSKIIDKFFTLNEKILLEYKEIKKRKNLENQKYVFIWCRKTDKVYEIPVPEVETYINLLKNENLINYKVIIQTDDKKVFDEFKKCGLNFDHVEEIPFAKGESFHQLISHTDDSIFESDYGITKIDYFRKMFCVLLLSVNADYTVIYPGNPTTVVPIYKGCFDNCFLYKDNVNLI